MPNARGKSKHNLLKNAKGRLYYFLVCPVSNFFKSKLSAEPFTCPRGKSLLENCRPFFETQICPGPIATNVCVSAVVPFRSRVLSHETKTLNEDKILNQLVTAPLQKHTVGGSTLYSVTNSFTLSLM